MTFDANKQEKEEKNKMPKNDYLKHIKKIKKQREEKHINNHDLLKSFLKQSAETVEPTDENLREAVYTPSKKQQTQLPTIPRSTEVTSTQFTKDF